jgi:outer membrane protein OmpA-like peptidoglycan-associated protein
MKRTCGLIAAGIALLALPLAAQEKNDGSNSAAADARRIVARDSGELGNSAAPIHAPARDFFALPDAPRPTPFPAAAGNTSDPPGRLVPRYEVSGGFSYVNFNPGSPFDSFNNFGGQGSFALNPSRYLGLVAEFTGYNFERNLTGTNVRGSWNTWLFGPRLNLRRDYFVPFVEFLVGGSHGDLQITGTSSQNAFALAAGGGVDVVFSKYVAWRFAQIDYLMTNFSGVNVGGNARQDNLRLGTGIVLRFGFPPNAPPPPPAPKGPPTASCSATPSSVFAGATDTVTVHVAANSPDNFPLTYSYTASGGTVDGNGPDARWNPSGVNPGSYTITAKLDDGKGGTTSCNADVRVEEKPHHPPTVSVTANPTTILPGERSAIACNATSPDNLPLTYAYSATSGQVSGNGPQGQYDSTGAQPGTASVKCEVTDSRGDKGDGSANVEVQQPPPPPQATKVGDCDYKAGISRVDNACKRILDDVSLRLKNEPNAKVVVVGYADPKEPRASALAAKRAELVKAFLGEKGIDASRISTRTGEASKEGTDRANRRIEAIFVPEGATY